MAQKKSIRDIMTPRPVVLPASSSVVEAARAMRDANIGDVIVHDNHQICGIVTDRDIVVRALAEGHDPATTKIAQICSRELTTLSPSDTADDAMRLMRDRALRRLPVVENDQPVGIVSIGDLAIRRDRKSVLADISAAPPNR